MSDIQFGNYKNYKQTVIDITSDLKKLKEYCDTLKLNANSNAIEGAINKLSEDNFNVAIVGEFKRGKSTLINALLEKDILPTDVIPTTATLNKVTYGITPYVHIEFHDGHSEDIEIDKLNDYVTKLTPESEEMSRTVKVATVYYPINYCKNGVTIIDTPGLNDDEAMTSVTLSVLPETDAAIMVMMAGSPFSQYERDFLEKKIIAGDLARVIFVVTGIDLYDEDDAEKILNAIRTRIIDSILNKAKNVYGEDSEEYASYKTKLGSIQIYGLSAKKALKAKQKNNHEMLQDSKFPVFEKGLEKFLTEERGAIALSVPLNRIQSSCMEIVKAINLRHEALNMEQSEFEEKQKKALAEIERIRQDRKEEFERVNVSAQNAYTQLIPRIENYWDELKAAADNEIDSYPLSASDLESKNYEATAQALNEQIQSAIKQRSQELSEAIQGAINNYLEDEAERLSSFESRFIESTDSIQQIFINTEISDSSDITSTIAAFGAGMFASSLLLGAGGIFAGYKEGGMKGALIGGGVGIAGGTAVFLAATALLPLSWPVVIAASALASIAGTFGGKWVTQRMFSDNRIENFKNEFKDAVHSQIDKMCSENTFNETVKNQINEAFDSLKTKIHTETERVLTDTEQQLKSLKDEIVQKTSMSEFEKQRYQDMQQSITDISQRSVELNKDLAKVLTREGQ